MNLPRRQPPLVMKSLLQADRPKSVLALSLAIKYFLRLACLLVTFQYRGEPQHGPTLSSRADESLDHLSIFVVTPPAIGKSGGASG